MHEHRLGEHEAADEDEDHRIGERGEHLAGRRDLQHHRQDRAEDRGDGERQRLAHPEHDDGGHDGGEAVRRRGEAERRRQQRHEHGRGQQESGRAPDALDTGFDVGDALDGRCGGQVHGRGHLPRPPVSGTSGIEPA